MGEGQALDPATLLRTAEGKPRAAIVYLAHLSDAERQFVVTLVLSKLVTWMRGQPGTSDLRTLVYMDEVFGFVPPTAEPPAKKPILTVLKQGRAFGVGMVLATQNPVDLDYKVMSNAGPWLVGRLQTERDKARVLEGLKSAAGGADVAALDTSIGGLQKRQFLLVSAKSSQPVLFQTRWAMSYLRGPLTKDQIATLMKDVPRVSAPAAVETAAPAAPEVAAAVPASASAPSPAAGDDSATPVAPPVAAGITVAYLDPAAAWAAQVGATPGATRLRAFLAARVALRFDDTTAGVDEQQEYEALYGPLDTGLDLDAEHAVDYDDRDLRPDVPSSPQYVLPAAPIADASFFRDAERDITRRLVDRRTLDVFRNKVLKLTSRPGETQEQFLARCDLAAQQAADAEAATIKSKLEAKQAKLQAALEIAQRRVAELDTQTRAREANELIAGAGRSHRRPLRRQAQRPLDHERNRLGRVETRDVGDGLRAPGYGAGEGSAVAGHAAAGRAGDPGRGAADRCGLAGQGRPDRDALDSPRGRRRPRREARARLGALGVGRVRPSGLTRLSRTQERCGEAGGARSRAAPAASARRRAWRARP